MFVLSSEENKITSLNAAGQSLYIVGEICNMPTEFLIDTGAMFSVISSDIIAKLPYDIKEKFKQKSAVLTAVDGRELEAQGPVMLDLKIGDQSITTKVYATQCSDNAILGLNTLMQLNFIIKIGNSTFNAQNIKNNSIRRITTDGMYNRRVLVANDITVPARSQYVISANVTDDFGTKISSNNKQLLVESDIELHENIVIGKTLVNMSSDTIPINVMNFSNEPVKLLQKEFLGMVSEAEEVMAADYKPKGGAVEDDNLPACVEELWKETCKEPTLSDAGKEQLRKLLLKHKQVFAKDNNDLGRTNVVMHDVDTGNAPPVRQQPRRIPTALQGVVDQHIGSMLKHGVIERTQSPWASPVVLAKKHDGTYRFCVDYRKVNSLTTFDAYPLNRIDDTLEALSGAKWFCTLDLLSGFWQCGMTERAKQRSAFCVPKHGLFTFNVMPMGMKNSPSTFSRLMEIVLTGLNWRQCVVYLDDVVLFAKTEEEMLQILDEVFGRFAQANLKLKPVKCHLFKKETRFLGHVISGSGISMDPERVKCIIEWVRPKDVSEVRSFLGITGYYRKYIHHFADKAAALYKLTNKEQAFIWGSEQETAFETLKQALITAPMLAYPEQNDKLILDTDASGFGLGAVLSAVREGKERVLGFASRSLTDCERRYCVTRKELLAVVWAIRHFKTYLYGRKFLVRTDHHSLVWLMNFRDADGQLGRWLDTLNLHTFDIDYRPGKKHSNADGLSRRPCAQCTRPDCKSGKIQINTIRLKDRCTERVNLLTIGSTWTKTELASKQDDDSDIKFIKDLFVSGIKPDYKEVNAWGKERKCYFRNWERLYVDDDNVLCRWWYDNNGEKEFLQVIAPRAIRRDILQAAHDSPTGGHFAEKKTRRAISSHYWWANCIDGVKHWCQSCVTCGGRKGAPTRPAHALVQDPTGEPMQRIAIDIIGAVNPPSVSGNKYIVVVTDYLTKWTEAYATTNQTAENVASILVKEFICRYGIPIQIHSDKGAQFEGEIFKHICRLLNIRKTNTTSYHPSGDGQVERANRVIIDTLAKLTQDDQNSWDDKLPFVMAAYRSSSHSSTDYTPNFLMLGREVNCPLSLLNPPPNEKLTPWVEGLRDKFKVAHEIAVQNNKRAHISQKAQHDKRSKDFNFQNNTLVWLFDPVLQKGIGNKLNPYKWRGPHKILKHLSECVVLIEETASGKKRVVNVDRLRPYTERSDVRFPTERQDDDNVPVDNDKQDDEEATSIYLADRVTNRPQRERRHPTKFNDYV